MRHSDSYLASTVFSNTGGSYTSHSIGSSRALPLPHQEMESRDISGSPVAKTLCSQCRGPGFDF